MHFPSITKHWAALVLTPFYMFLYHQGTTSDGFCRSVIAAGKCPRCFAATVKTEAWLDTLWQQLMKLYCVSHCEKSLIKSCLQSVSLRTVSQWGRSAKRNAFTVRTYIRAEAVCIIGFCCSSLVSWNEAIQYTLWQNSVLITVYGRIH